MLKTSGRTILEKDASQMPYALTDNRPHGAAAARPSGVIGMADPRA
jgi:hypothetical protein